MATSGFVDVEGTRLYYEVAGSGPPVVLLHGIGRSLGSLVTLPWHLAFNQQVFFAEEPWSPVLP